MKDFSLIFEISSRLLLQKGFRSLGVTGWISFLGLMLGVGSLVVSMAVVSGFESTLQRAVVDVTGHVQLLKTTGLGIDEMTDVKKQITDYDKETRVVKELTPFLKVDAVGASRGQVAMITLQGLDEKSVHEVLSLKRRLIAGVWSLKSVEENKPTLLIGKALAKKLSLQVGDDFKVVVPMPSELDPTRFQRRLGTYKIQGILDFGKIEFDEHFVLMDISELQKLSEVGPRISGLLLLLKDDQKTTEVAASLARELGPHYGVMSWRDLNENMLEAVKIEKVVIFFVILIIVIAAAFNVSSSLFVSVVQRYPEIGILKTIGLSRKKIIQVFSLQGLMLGGIGCLGGVLLGLFLCVGFSVLQSWVTLLPGSVYRLDHIDVSIRFLDLTAIVLVTFLICFVATLAPAMMGAKLTPIEGLRYE